jgi:signal transduction histidine kinase/CheY-like chemotaxis protein
VIPAPLPPDEQARLESLARYEVLDTAPEQGFDDLTALASHVCDCPVALVTFVDERRQWFKSRHGIDATETPRELSFCGHAILTTAPLVVPDTAVDARFFDNPLCIDGPRVRFYAGAPLVTPDGHALGTICVVDQTPRRLSAAQVDALERIARQVVTQLELRRVSIRAQRAAAAKAEFLATMSHEIRTPLNGVIGMTRMLLETPLSPEQREYAETVEASGEHLLAVLNDVLDFSKLEAGRVELECVPFDLHELCARALALFTPAARAKGVALELAWRLRAPSGRRGDPTRVRQVLLNLLGNALKFTTQGAVRVCVDGDDDGRVRVAVCDTGIGIAADALPRLFTRFAQADASTARRFGGTGLGLAISHMLTERMGGSLRAESALGAGSTFTFTLCLPVDAQAQASPARHAPDDDDDLSGARVLVAEDNPVNQRVLRRLLERLGCEATITVNGAEAVAVARAHDFDVVLMDCQMPELDGFEATEAIRRGDGPSARVPIIALTAGALEQDRTRCLAVGMNDFLTKPVERPALAQALRRALGIRPTLLMPRRSRLPPAA